MNIFFDVDYTILSMDGALRPHVVEVFQKLKEDGHDLYIWSGVGMRTEVVRRFKLGPYISNIYVKPLSDHISEMTRMGIDPFPDFCVDDHQEIIDALGGMRVRAFTFWREIEDHEMLKVYETIREFSQNNSKGTESTK